MLIFKNALTRKGLYKWNIKAAEAKCKTKVPFPFLTREVVIALHSSTVKGTISAKLQVQ